jgi:hypothetical protein
MAEAIEKAAASPLRTEAGEALAADRRRIMLDFARKLTQEEEEFRAGVPEVPSPPKPG